MRHYIVSTFTTFALILTGGLIACGDSDNESNIADTSDAIQGGADTSDTGGADTPDIASGACNTLVNGGEQVPETAGVVFFSPMGGAVADGTYHLTEFKIFAPGSVDPFKRRHALRVTGNRVEIVTQKDNEAELRMNATMALSADTVTFTVDCPQPATFSFGYTASSTEFIHIVDEPGTKEVHTYTLQ